MLQTGLRLLLLLAILCPLALVPTVAHGQEPVVQAVLFYSPSCPHCHQVIAEFLPPIQDTYGEQLQIVFVDVSMEGGSFLYRNAIEAFEIPPERQGVPTMIIGDQVLVGSVEIPNIFPGLLEEGLASGGVSWPAIPGLAEALGIEPDEPPVEGEEPVEPTGGEPDDPPVERGEPVEGLEASVVDRVMRDPVGNGLSIAVLVAMIGSLGIAFDRWRHPGPVRRNPRDERRPAAALILLMAVGLMVASYLAFVETTQSTAVCGPVGDCNTVQTSSYAILFGVLPVGVLGVVGYLAMAVAWGAGFFGEGSLRDFGILALAAMALAGTLFSLYLTFLEPFVIGATCAWCLSSAVIMTASLLFTVRPARLAFDRVVR